MEHEVNGLLCFNPFITKLCVRNCSNFVFVQKKKFLI